MYQTYTDIRNCALDTTDAHFGAVEDVYLDDQTWTVSYLIAATGTWLFGRKVLLSREVLQKPDLDKATLSVSLTNDEIKEAADADSVPPVSQQGTAEPTRRDLSPYLIAPPDGAYSPLLAEQHLASLNQPSDAPADPRPKNPHLRSMNELTGYGISATDGEIGTVIDALIEPDSWKIQYLIIDMGTWLPGRQVVISTDWITSVNWAERQISIRFDKKAVEDSPEVGDLSNVERGDLDRLHAHFAAPMV